MVADATLDDGERRCSTISPRESSYSRPPHRRNRFFRAVETAVAQETAVLETRRFLRAPIQYKKPAHRHTHHPRPTHPMHQRALKNTMARCCASRPSTEASRTLAHHRHHLSRPPPRPSHGRLDQFIPRPLAAPPALSSPPSPSVFRAPFSRGAHSPTHRSSTHHWSTPWVRQ